MSLTTGFYLDIIAVSMTMFIFVKTLSIKNKKSLHLFFILTIMCILIWNMSIITQYLFYMKNSNAIVGFSFVGICLIAPSLFLTALFFRFPEKNFKPFYLIYYVVPIISSILAFTNEYHHLFMINHSFYHKENIYGPYFIIHSVYSFSIVFIGLGLLISYAVKNSGILSKQAQLIIIGSIVPVSQHLVITLNLMDSNQLFNGLGFTFAVFLFWLAIVNYGFLNIVPIALPIIVDNISEGFAVISTDYSLINFNKAFKDMFADTLNIEKDYNILNYAQKLDIDSNDAKKFIENAVLNKKSLSIDKHIKNGGFDKYLSIEATPIYSHGRYLGVVLLFKDITSLKKNIIELEKVNVELKEQYQKVEELNIRLKNMADTDSLTGVYNRRYFDEFYAVESERILSAMRHKPQYVIIGDFGVALLDIDDFKLVNDTYGHDTGDKVLKQTVDIIRSSVFNRDIVCRYGGEEFVIIFPNSDKSGIIKATEKIRYAVDSYNYDFGVKKDGHVTVSIGVAMFVESYIEGEDISSVLKVIDNRLYKAKRTGKNKVVFD